MKFYLAKQEKYNRDSEPHFSYHFIPKNYDDFTVQGLVSSDILMEDEENDFMWYSFIPDPRIKKLNKENRGFMRENHFPLKDDLKRGYSEVSQTLFLQYLELRLQDEKILLRKIKKIIEDNT